MPDTYQNIDRKKHACGLFENFFHWTHSSQDNSATVNEVGDRCEQTQRNNSEGDFWTSVATSKTLKVESYLPGKSHARNFSVILTLKSG